MKTSDLSRTLRSRTAADCLGTGYLLCQHDGETFPAVAQTLQTVPSLLVLLTIDQLYCHEQISPRVYTCKWPGPIPCPADCCTPVVRTRILHCTADSYSEYFIIFRENNSREVATPGRDNSFNYRPARQRQGLLSGTATIKKDL